MNKKNILITILIGFAIGVFILQPLGITIFTFSSQNYEINWGQYLINNFIEIVNINNDKPKIPVEEIKLKKDDSVIILLSPVEYRPIERRHSLAISFLSKPKIMSIVLIFGR